MEDLFTKMVIDACEGHGIGTFDAPGAYLHAKLPKGKHAGLDITRVPMVFNIIFNIKNKLVCMMMSSMLSIFSFRALDELDLEIWDF